MNIYAHRGNSGFFPENTMYAFKKSLDLDICGIELDVQKTKDGILVVHHDETLGRVFDGKGYIKKLTFDQLVDSNLNNDELISRDDCKIPTFEEVLELIKPTNLTINIEIKNNKVRYKGIEEDIINLVKKHNMEERVLISSFNYRSLKRIFRLDPTIKTAYLVGAFTFKHKSLKKVLKRCKECNCVYIHPSYDVVNKELVTEAHKKGISVQVYTVNSITIMKKLIKLKVDGVFTNYPKIINTIVNENL